VLENTLLSNKINFVMDEIPFVEHRRMTCGYIYIAVSYNTKFAFYWGQPSYGSVRICV
jgi:hypothetical protein